MALAPVPLRDCFQDCTEVRCLLSFGDHAAALSRHEVSILKVWFLYDISNDSCEAVRNLFVDRDTRISDGLLEWACHVLLATPMERVGQIFFKTFLKKGFSDMGRSHASRQAPR